MILTPTRSLFVPPTVIVMALLSSVSVANGANVRFEVSLPAQFTTAQQTGRLLVVIDAKRGDEPRNQIGKTSMKVPPLVIGRDVDLSRPERTWTVDDTCAIYPQNGFSSLPAGDYRAQAVLMVNRDIWRRDAEGNYYGAPIAMAFDPAKSINLKLSLNAQIEPETLPRERESIKYRKFKSNLLSRFHKRDIFLRVGILLPEGHATSTERYPLWVHIGGFGTRYTSAGDLSIHLPPKDLRMVILCLDGAGPLGDPYQVNSANNGPYGDAITQELIPYIEKEFRCIGEPRARFTEGRSTGGWVSLALQVFYPDYFNGCWSGSPDSVDFRQFELVNIYSDDNAYVNRHGAERPSKRDLSGEVVYTVRNECQRENVLGLGDSYTMGGLDWGSWNAVYGPRKDGRPVPIWDPQTGKIDRGVIPHWKSYDLCHVLTNNWPRLGPKLRGKLHIWAGERDEYYLNNAVHLLDNFLSQADPPYMGYVRFAPLEGHNWSPLSLKQIMNEMLQRVQP